MATDIIDASREVTIRAAEVFDTLRHQIVSLEKQLNDAIMELERRKVRIEVLDQGLTEAYLRIHQLENDRDLAVNERDEMRLIFYSFKTQLDALVVPLQPPPTKRKRNGKKDYDPVAVEEAVNLIKRESLDDLGSVPQDLTGVDNSGSGEPTATGTGSN